MMKLEEITDINEIDAVLSDAQMCRIALLDGDKPYIAPLPPKSKRLARLKKRRRRLKRNTLLVLMTQRLRLRKL